VWVQGDWVELFMKMGGWSRGRTLAWSLVFSLCVIGIALGKAQALDDGKQSGGSVEILELKEPVFPPLANQVRTEGDVKIELGIAPDGTVVSATVVSGHPMLVQAALQSAKSSKFACHGCEDGTTSYSMTYTFRAGESLGPGCCTGGGCPELYGAKDALKNQKRQHGTEVTRANEDVTVVGPSMCFCPDGCPVHFSKVRSWKCLYLWKCETPRRIGIM
jgi:TonB family protein